MKNIMIRFSCLILAVVIVSGLAVVPTHAADEISYFSTPEQADEAADEVRGFVESESEKSAAKVAAVESEVKAAKGDLREAVQGLLSAQQLGQEGKLAAARSRVAAARSNLKAKEKNAGKVLSAITAVKASTISSMRNQQMGWSEIARELGAARETIAPSIRSLSRETIERNHDLDTRQKKTKDRKSGTMRDLISGISITPGAIGGKGDKVLGLSRVSDKAQLGSNRSRAARSLAALGGRGNTPTASEAASMNTAIAKTRAKLAKMGIHSRADLREKIKEAKAKRR